MNELTSRLPILDVIFPALEMAYLMEESGAADYDRQEVKNGVNHYRIPYLSENEESVFFDSNTDISSLSPIRDETVHMKKWACRDLVRSNLEWHIRLGIGHQSKKVLYSDAGCTAINEWV